MYRNAATSGPSHGHRGYAQKFREDRSSGSRDMLADKQTDTQTDRLSDRNTPLLYRGEVINNFKDGVSCNFCSRPISINNDNL